MKPSNQIISEDGEFELWKIDRLTPYELNAKKHPPEQVKKIANSMRKYGFRRSKAIEVTPEGLIINGHGRRLAAIEAGLELVWVSVIENMNDEQIRAYRLSDNEVAKSDYDVDLVALELRSLHIDADYDMSDIFGQKDLEFITKDLGEMDLDALATDLSEQVDKMQSHTEKRLSAEGESRFVLTDALPFKAINAEQKRALTLLLSLAEGETNLFGIDALVAFTEGLLKRAA